MEKYFVNEIQLFICFAKMRHGLLYATAESSYHSK